LNWQGLPAIQRAVERILPQFHGINKKGGRLAPPPMLIFLLPACSIDQIDAGKAGCHHFMPAM
jgi:hypothetical protein